MCHINLDEVETHCPVLTAGGNLLGYGGVLINPTARVTTTKIFIRASFKLLMPDA